VLGVDELNLTRALHDGPSKGRLHIPEIMQAAMIDAVPIGLQVAVLGATATDWAYLPLIISVALDD